MEVKTMLLTINIGNTNTSFGVFEKDSISYAGKVKTHENLDVNFYNTIKKLNLRADKITGVIIGCVVPDKYKLVLDVLKKLNFPEPFIVDSKLSLPIKFAVDNSEEIGADLIANLVSAGEFYKMPLVIIDAGTATTFCMLLKDKEFIGAIIAPGLETLSKSLSENTALLPNISVKKPNSLMGRNTVECMQTGLYWGYIGLVQGIVNKIKEEHKNIDFIGTGGNIEQVVQEISGIKLDEHLTLKGLNRIYQINNTI